MQSWGSNANSALGQGMVPDTDAHPSPAPVAAVHDPAHPLTGVTSISGAMALLSDNSAVTWGSNTSGQLGNQSIGVTSTTPVLPFYPPSTTGGVPDFTEIASSGNVDLALSLRRHGLGLGGGAGQRPAGQLRHHAPARSA